TYLPCIGGSMRKISLLIMTMMTLASLKSQAHRVCREDVEDAAKGAVFKQYGAYCKSVGVGLLNDGIHWEVWLNCKNSTQSFSLKYAVATRFEDGTCIAYDAKQLN